MSKQKKFGAFAGVFTPSVLTILGVIMYMRLGWVVGNAGLITALVIIIISHVISVTTGLSISSVATDKKIKTGGIYYILSRSLGLPMGGAIGIALFVGTALSISLYLVGFAESLLAVDKFREFFHLAQDDLNSYRLIATIALLILVTLAFISTSLAIKSQYFILGAIALSLVSIIAGITLGTDFLPDTISITPLRNGVSMQEIFGVFFPAVTGFTAGVAMSGDLKKPEKDIPRGTLASIAVGFIVYVSLAIFFAFFVNRDLLVNDYNFLLKVSIYAPLVLAGIWGATLSSALGGILGGPRILQAIAKDKIVPKVFAKGYGVSNEPRNALIFIFLIAEGGILIGSLNVIAEVVSMFYLASYGFINLAFFLENWASTDFRPTFKVKGVIGLVGFIASFLVMAQLGLLSMFAALIIMFGIFALLNRKQLKSESGDVWQSVWLSVVRKALYTLNKKNLEERNWQPNIILFSGGENKRPYLLEFGKDLVGQYGLLSNFDLHESTDKKYLFPKHLQANPDKNGNLKGVFTRRQTCSDIYTGIETIISTYGFSGIEPNTVLMGWMRQSKNPVRFSQMIKRINELDVNLLLMDYDKRFGFGNYKTVDIWWRGSGNNGNLILNLMKFLWVSENWRDAKLRLLVGNPNNENSDKIRKHAEQVLNNMRIDAEIKIINNQIEQKPFYELIRTESLETDLIILGLPEVKEGQEEKFVADTDNLMQDIGTVILIKASSQFENLNLGLKYIQSSENKKILISGINFTDIETDINMPDNPVLAENIKLLIERINVFDDVYKDLLTDAFTPSYDFIDSIISEIENIINQKIKTLFETKNYENHKNLTVGLDKLLKTVQSVVRNYNTKIIPDQSDLIETAYKTVISEIEGIFEDIPNYVFCKYTEDDLRYNSDDNFKLRLFKKINRIKVKLQKKPVLYKIKYKEIVKQYIPYENLKIYSETGKKTGILHIQFITELQKLIKYIRTAILKLQALQKDNLLNNEQLTEIIDNIIEEINFLKQLKEDAVKTIYLFVHQQNTSIINKISEQINEVHPNRFIYKSKSKKEIEAVSDTLIQIPAYWKRNEQLFLNSWSLELLFLEFENRMYRIIGKSVNTAEELIRELIISKIHLLKKNFNTFLEKYSKHFKTNFVKTELSEITDKNEISYLLKNMLISGFEKFQYLIDRFPEKIELFSDDAVNDITEHQFEDINTIEVSVSSLLDFVIQTELNEPLTAMLATIPVNIFESEQAVHNVQSIILLTLFDNEGKILNYENNSPEDIINFINKQLSELDKLETKSKAEIINFQRKVNERLSEVSNHLNIKLLMKNTESSKIFAKKKIQKEKKNDFFSNINFSLKRIKSHNKKNKIRKIELFKRTPKYSQETISKVKRTLDLVLKVSPDKEISESLPFFYRQLFLREENFNSDFFVNRKRELLQAEETLKRYELGYKGGVLITGEPYSGKSFLSHYIAGKYLNDRELYVIKPPVKGSVSPKIFDNTMDDVLNIKSFTVKKFSKIKPGSVFLFDALELWWENSESGFEIIDKLKNLIQTYGKRFLFIVNLNLFALRQLNKNYEFENYFLNIIECSPFSAFDLSEAIFKRHNAGGISYFYKNKHQNRIKPVETEKLFEDYLSFTEGNIGTAIFTWISEITDYKEGTIVINSPEMPDTSALTFFSDETNQLLFQFLLHRRMSIKKTVRILKKEEKNIVDNFAFLQRSGIISEIVKDIFEINPFLYIHIKRHLKEKGFLDKIH